MLNRRAHLAFLLFLASCATELSPGYDLTSVAFSPSGIPVPGNITCTMDFEDASPTPAIATCSVKSATGGQRNGCSDQTAEAGNVFSCVIRFGAVYPKNGQPYVQGTWEIERVSALDNAGQEKMWAKKSELEGENIVTFELGSTAGSGEIMVSMTNATGLSWEMFDADTNVSVGSGTAPGGTVSGLVDGTNYYVVWEWDEAKWPTFIATDGPIGANSRPYATGLIQPGNTASVVYQTRPIMDYSKLNLALNMTSNRPETGADIISNSFHYMTSREVVGMPDWNQKWPTVTARNWIRPVSPVGEVCSSVSDPASTTCTLTTNDWPKFWLFWEGTGDVEIDRLGVGSPFLYSIEHDLVLDANGQVGLELPIHVNHNVDTGEATLMYFDIHVDNGTGTLSDLELVHESYLGTTAASPDPAKKCYRCIPGPDADGWYWVKGGVSEDDTIANGAPVDNYCSLNCTETTFVTEEAKEMAKYLTTLRYLTYDSDPNQHTVEECSNTGNCINTILFHENGRDASDLLIDEPFQRAFTVLETYQTQINVCNALNKDCWFIFPYWENQALQTALIEAIEDDVTGLRDGLKVYIEYGNEIWNYSSPYNVGLEYASHMAFHHACAPSSWTQNGWVGVATEQTLWGANPCEVTPGFEDLATQIADGAQCRDPGVSCVLQEDCPANSTCTGGSCSSVDTGNACVSDANCNFACEAREWYTPQYRYQAYRLWKIATDWDAYLAANENGKYATLHDRLRPVLGFQAANTSIARFAVEQNNGTNLSFDFGATKIEDWVYAFAIAYYPVTAYQDSGGFFEHYSAGADSEYWAYVADLQDNGVDTHWLPIWKNQVSTSAAKARGLKWLTYEGGSWDWNPAKVNDFARIVDDDWYYQAFKHPINYVNTYETLRKLDAETDIELLMEYHGPVSHNNNARQTCDETPCTKFGYYGLRDTMHEPIEDSHRYKAVVDYACMKSVSDSAVCGNGLIDAGEECETGIPLGATCESLGFGAGTLACSSCQYNTSGCTEPPPSTCVNDHVASYSSDGSVNGWSATQDTGQAATTTVTLTFYARVTPGTEQGIVGISDITPITIFNNNPIAIRFSDQGVIDVVDKRLGNGGASGCNDGVGGTTCPMYTAGEWYRFSISADLTSDTYSVQHALCDDPLQPLNIDAQFRSDSCGGDGLCESLRYHAAYTNAGGAVEVSGFTWSPL